MESFIALLINNLFLTTNDCIISNYHCSMLTNLSPNFQFYYQNTLKLEFASNFRVPH